MVTVVKICIECGREFATVWDKRCDDCQRKHSKTYALKPRKRLYPYRKE